MKKINRLFTIMTIMTLFFMGFSFYSFSVDDLGSLKVYNAGHRDYYLLKTHDYQDERFASKNDLEEFYPVKVEDHLSFESLPLGRYRLVSSDNHLDYYTLSFPDDSKVDPLHQELVLKNHSISLEMLIGLTRDTLTHHHLDNPLFLNVDDYFYYGLKIQIPSHNELQHYDSLVIEDYFPEGVIHHLGDFEIEASNGVTLVEGVDYIYTYNPKITVTITASGITKLKEAHTLFVSYGMSFVEGYVPTTELVGNNATLYLQSKDALRALESEDDYFTFLFKSLRIEKVEKNTLKALSGALFTLYRGEDKIETLRTDEKGYATFHNLEVGNYRVVEEEAPHKYKKLKGPLDVTIDDDDSLVSVVVENEPFKQLPKTGVEAGISLILATAFISGGVYLRRRSSDETKH